MNRENAKLVIVAVFCLVIGLSAPAVSATVQHALYADKAGKVDGRDAVGAAASMTQRRGKLVATSATSGRLPNNIIAKAPDAARLGGFTAKKLRAVSMPASGLGLSGAALYGSAFGAALQTGGTGNAGADFYVPSNHHQADDIFVDIVVYSEDPSPCDVHLGRSGRIFTPGTGSFKGSAWLKLDGTDPATQPVEDYRLLTYRLDEPAAPGSVVHLTLTRIDDVADTCNAGFWIVGLQFRY